MRERLELGPLTPVDPRTAPTRVEFLGPALLRRVHWIAGAILSIVFVWSIGLAAGWFHVSGWLLSGRRFPAGVEHLLWSLPVLLALVCMAMAVSGVRVSIGTERLGIYGIWPRAYAKTFELARLSSAAFDLERAARGERLYRIALRFPDAEIVLHTPDRHTWEALRARFRDRLGR